MLTHFTDRHQNFWQMASIQAAASGIPVLVVGKDLVNTYGFGTALLAILIGNSLLWVIGLATVTMSFKRRENAIETVRDYLGVWGSRLAALVLLAAFITWFTIQVESGTISVTSLVNTTWGIELSPLRVGTFFGMACTLAALGGMKLIRRICVYTLPFQLAFVCYVVLSSGHIFDLSTPWAFSLPATVTVAMNTLPGYVLLPTFFRHSRSRGHSAVALACIVLLTMFFQFAGIAVQGSISEEHRSFIFAATGPMIITSSVTLIFIFLSALCATLVDVYFASAGWEALAPVFSGRKELAIIGLLGTAIYALFQVGRALYYVEDLTNGFIASLGVVLLLAFLVKMLVQHRPRTSERFINTLCWLVGCLAVLSTSIGLIRTHLPAPIVGMITSAFLFLIFMFVEETAWGISSFKRKEDNA